MKLCKCVFDVDINASTEGAVNTTQPDNQHRHQQQQRQQQRLLRSNNNMLTANIKVKLFIRNVLLSKRSSINHM